MRIERDNLLSLAGKREAMLAADVVKPDRHLSLSERIAIRHQADRYREAAGEAPIEFEAHPHATVLVEPLWAQALDRLAHLPERIRYRIFAAVCVVVPAVVVGGVWLITR